MSSVTSPASMREIENLVDQRQQMLGADEDVREVVDLPLGQGLAVSRDDASEADDRVQRGAQLVAHVRQKTTLGRRCFHRRVAGHLHSTSSSASSASLRFCAVTSMSIPATATMRPRRHAPETGRLQARAPCRGGPGAPSPVRSACANTSRSIPMLRSSLSVISDSVSVSNNVFPRIASRPAPRSPRTGGSRG